MSQKLFRNTLLFLTSNANELIPNSRNLIEHSFRLTQSNLFVYFVPGVVPALVSVSKTKPELRLLVAEFYKASMRVNPNVNVVCLLHNIHLDKPVVRSGLDYDAVLTDVKLNVDLEKSIRSHLEPIFSKLDYEIHSVEASLEKVESPKSIEFSVKENDLIAANKSYHSSIIGGTFDRIHIGHKMLLTESLILTRNRLLIGLADGPLLVKKKLTELIEDAATRERNLRDLVSMMRPDLDELVIVPIHDPFGPSITEPDYQCLIVSEETRAVGDVINEKRRERSLPLLDIHVIGLTNENQVDAGDELKVSSSNERRHLLGTLLKPPVRPASPNEPYIIGLTGGLASGKSAILNDLSRLGAGTIDCDKLGHQVYIKDTSGYHQLVDTFGQQILSSNGEIDRKELGKLVFNNDDKSNLKKLTDIVWPEVKRMVQQETRDLYRKGHKVVVVEAPLLIEAGWTQSMNEIWVVFVPYNEALQRAMRRDSSDEAKVRATLNTQLPNKERIKHANVVFSSLWEREYTIKQVQKAWNSLQQRIN